MANELIINASLPETRIALMEDGEIQELLIERASGKGIVGNIYKGRVTRVLPGMQAAFVDIGLERRHQSCCQCSGRNSGRRS
jgi:ribonuclease G